jgi:hypothetical protein
MRHPAAPTIIAVLLGFLVFMLVWARWRRDGHHEGNPDHHVGAMRDERWSSSEYSSGEGSEGRTRESHEDEAEAGADP